MTDHGAVRASGAARRLRVLSHEEAAHEKRNWVRLTHDCNNHCIFCLDTEAHNGTMRAVDAIKAQIVAGRRRGAERLILSGGEPTMHPNFLDFVRLGQRAGYPKIQTVTNGRMFAYPEFLAGAAEAGLHEITFSVHGHTAKLHDALVGTPGAFEEETAGLRAALASARFIVNVDIVINKLNVAHLADMLETFIGWGVKEFDLLQVIPFGAAWGSAREHLFYDLEGNLEHLQRAFAYSLRPDVHLWLNRFPPAFAEGFEELIQDPYKLHDEVRGRREEFDRYLAFGKKLDCREPERCRRCYLEELCDGLEGVVLEARAPQLERVRVVAPLSRAMPLPKAVRAWIVAPDVDQAVAVARELGVEELELELERTAGLAARLERDVAGEVRLAGRPVRRVHARDAARARELLAIDAPFEVLLELRRDTAPFALELARAGGAALGRLALRQPNHVLVTEARAHDVDLEAFAAELDAACGDRAPAGSPAIENAPRCLVGARARPMRATLDAAMLGSDGRVDMGRYTERFVAERSYGHALRCGGCAARSQCAGVHINWVRAHGFAALDPAACARST
ncbi:MAG: radical SAM protein [Polyangiaceae bacterium]|nr:radical SAM protein [Polyangiaceae bacterium]